MWPVRDYPLANVSLWGSGRSVSHHCSINTRSLRNPITEFWGKADVARHVLLEGQSVKPGLPPD
jgi:hypothetical protein